MEPSRGPQHGPIVEKGPPKGGSEVLSTHSVILKCVGPCLHLMHEVLGSISRMSDKWMHRCMDGCMDGWMDKKIHAFSLETVTSSILKTVKEGGLSQG